MSSIDWLVLLGTLGFIAIYGAWKTRKSQNIEGYLKGDSDMKWATIGLSVMATQASAITFISTPGQAYESGMGFVQNYLGLPIALIIVSAVFIPIYYKLKVYTAYEYLETRFGVESRLLAASLFLIQRGLAAGITIYAPAIIIATALGWQLDITILLIGALVIVYTVSGGTKAVSLTQKWQMAVIMGGMFIAFFIIIFNLPENVSFGEAVSIAGIMDKMNVIDFSLDIDKRYTFWTGITGGTFLALSYFGTDQSQVQRYLSGKSVYESRMGLMFNALLKIPMQFFILFVGIMVFVFFQFQEHRILFNQTSLDQAYQTEYAPELKAIEDEYQVVFSEKKYYLEQISTSTNQIEIDQAISLAQQKDKQEIELKNQAKAIILKAIPESKSKDSDYIFLSFIMNYMPIGLIGLLLAVIFSAAMSSTSGELNALASTSTIDFYKRLSSSSATASDRKMVIISKLFTAFWGIIAITFALFAQLLENLIEAVNILGSIFYGTILGIFLVAFFINKIKGKATFIAAIIAQAAVIILHFFGQDIFSYLLQTPVKEIGYLWYNVIGCGLVIGLAALLQVVIKGKE